MPNHYLIERAGMAGGTIRELGVGSKITIDGQTYTVFKVLSGVANDENAFNLLLKVQQSLSKAAMLLMARTA